MRNGLNVSAVRAAHGSAPGWDRAVLGHDCRHSSPVYHQAVGRGLNASGVDVLFLTLFLLRRCILQQRS